jgi:arginyl-tRNA synthetase
MNVVSVEIAGPGFINVTLTDDTWRAELATILAEAGDDYGRSTAGRRHDVNVEYVSANPTGPMHMGHCRGAVVGDALASLLELRAQGHREYYINDAGAQVDARPFGAPALPRGAGRDGEIPEGLYPGDYLKPVGQALAAEYGDRLSSGAPESEWLDLFRARPSRR